VQDQDSVSSESEPQPSESYDSTRKGIPGGPTALLAADAAVTLVREELAHAVAVSIAFFHMILMELEAGRTPCAENLTLAREEVDRMRKLIASLRGSPGIRVAPGRLRLMKGLRAACRDLERSPRASIEVILDVPESIVVSADVTALGLVVYSVVTALAARGATRVVLSVVLPPPESTSITLWVVPEFPGSAVSTVFIARAWAGADRDALTFAIARRAARAAGMLLRPVAHDGKSGLCLEIQRIPSEQ
jgi:hypothetical protein